MRTIITSAISSPNLTNHAYLVFAETKSSEVKHLMTSKQRLKTQVCRLRRKLKMEQKTPCRSSPVDNKLQDKKRKSKKVDRLCNGLADILSGPALDFVVCQVQQAKRKKHGLRWNCKDKALALSLFHSSPRTYKLLQKVSNLP